MLEVIDGADMVKFAKNGSDVTTAAVKLARAYTGRDLIAICGDQPFFSTDDWFIGTTEMNAGIPQAIIEMTLKFRYNDLGSLRELFDQHPGQIACVVMEAEAATPPAPGYLKQVKELCEQRGAVLDFRRDDHRLPLASGRSAEISRRRSASVHFRQGHGKRVCDLGIGRQA